MPTSSRRPPMPAAQSPAKKLQATTAKAALENRLSKQFAAGSLRPTPLRPTPLKKSTPLNLPAGGAMIAQPTPRVGPLQAATVGDQQLPPPAALGITSLPSPPAPASGGTADIGLTAAEQDRLQSLFLANLSMNLSAVFGLPANAAATAQQTHLTTMFAQAVEQIAPAPNSRPVTSLREARLADQTQIFKLMQDITTIKNSPQTASQFNGLIRQ